MVAVLVLVIYDVSDNEKRNNLANYLKTKGFTRIQRSAFVGRPLPSTLLDVERTVPRLIDQDTDVVHIFPLPETSVQRVRVFGKPLAELAAKRSLVVIA